MYYCDAYYSAKVDFITLNSKGSLTSKQIDIFIGDPGQAFVIFSKDVGFAMKVAITQQSGMSLVSDPERVPLTFFHESRHFAHNMCSAVPTVIKPTVLLDVAPYPRIAIEKDLPRPNRTNTSPATLWLWGASHSITLHGTKDHEFEESSRESHVRLKGAADLLKDV
ncbi:hypothetical protein CCM_04258 [Cordyceps militaris CM01]|uniref:Uncharacterized protein n=1 Tax=Cordyceps militaris (strain CM01) TaxID=983644 RepID=G3JE61_CORMM|nr:uncharacterized protein CCM_04258 [Cordyceps militaris CM01]EGX92886.1 hypothetical protein CCM_04258 [Cordyceps militaris CM01]